MKKKIVIISLAAVLLLAVLFVPIPYGVMKDGGTREYRALTYKIVDWNRITEDGIYEQTRVYFGSNRNKSISELWELEQENVLHQLIATVLDISGNTVTVVPVTGESELYSSDRITFSSLSLADIDVTVGSTVEVYYTGQIMESYPAQIHATAWKISKTLRHLDYNDLWLDKSTAEVYDSSIFSDIIITEIYANCFFAETVIPMPYQIKLNGKLSEEWCVGDQVICTYENTYYDSKSNRVEADLLTVKASDFEIDPDVCYKPVIYLYPETEAEISVKLTLDGRLTCTYPTYGDGWTVTASPDGTLTDASGQTYNYLYWEGETYAQYDLTQGFCVKGEDTAAFLEEALAMLGLNRREANEFIVYWLPLMQDNPYNVISFQTERYTDAAELEVTPAPETLIRVFMAWRASEEAVVLPEQELKAPDRVGFTVVEWGGTELAS